MNVYITQQGDTWDLLAFRFWGSEYLMTDLVEANQKYRHYIEFPEGIELIIPDMETDEESELPDWLINDEDEESDDDLENSDDNLEDNEDMEGIGNDEDNEIN